MGNVRHGKKVSEFKEQFLYERGRFVRYLLAFSKRFTMSKHTGGSYKQIIMNFIHIL